MDAGVRSGAVWIMKNSSYRSNSKLPLKSERDDESTEGRYMPWLPSPPKLVEYAGDRVNELPMPECWDWTVEDVVRWLTRTVELPQYRDCIRHNFINGRRLLLLETFGVQKIGIRDFSHIQRIMTAVRRELYGVERPKPKRSIGLPPRYPWTHYLFYRVPTGPTREATKPFELFEKMGIIDEREPCPFGHWQMINPTPPDFPCKRFGFAPRKSVYWREEHDRQPRGHSFMKRSKAIPNYFIRVDTK